MKDKKGFTLIELLVTIVLFSLLLATALYSFRFISINIRNINNTNPQEAMNFNLLKDVFSATYAYIDTDKNKFVGRERYSYYFYGKKNSCRFISNSSLFYNEMVVVQLTFQKKKLIYEEGRIFDKNINYQMLNKIKLTHKITLLKNIETLNFKYYKKGKNLSAIDKKIPESIELNFTRKLQKYTYFFVPKSNNATLLETLIRDYDLMHSQRGAL